MNEIMTMQEIEDRFDQEWVLLEDPVTNERLDVLEGKLLWHTPDHDEIWQKALELRPKHSAVFRVGPLPKDMYYML